MSGPRSAALACGVLLAFLQLSGCSGGSTRHAIVSSVGPYGDVAVVISDDALRAGTRDVLDSINPDVAFVLKSEKYLRFDFFPEHRWQDARNYRNIIYVMRWGDGGGLQREVESLLSDQTLRQMTSGSGGLAYLDDPYFKNQLLFVAVSPDRNSLISVLNGRKDYIAEMLRERSIARMIDDHRHQGLLPGVAAQLWREHAFSLEIPATFRPNQERPHGFDGLEWIRNDPTRGISVAWRAADDPAAALGDREFLQRLREDLGRELHGEEIHPASFVWSEETVAGLPAVKLAGAWSSRRVTAGGPFWCYFVADPRRGRVLCLDLLVYAPDRPKMDYFRRMRAILGTLSLEPPR